MATDVKTGQAIYSGAPGVGLRNVGSYQISGEPWVSGSGDAFGAGQHPASKVKRYQFPFVTREVSVANLTTGNGAYIFVHFASGSEHTFSSTAETTAYNPLSNVFQGNHYFPVSGSSILTFRAKCKEIYITTDAQNTTAKYRILADLTNVPTGRMYELTGSGHTDAP